MNNLEKEAAAVLKNAGFHVFWEESNSPRDPGGYWATHPKLIYQYYLNTNWRVALDDLNSVQRDIAGT